MPTNIYLILCGMLLLMSTTSWAVGDVDIYGSSLFRYESDFNNPSAENRRRLRLDAQLGLQVELVDAWYSDFRLSTGLKNKQNVPAITLKQFTNQSIPDNDIYLDRYYLAHRQNGSIFNIGKLPWTIKRNNDIFWDNNLNPYGMTFHWLISPQNNIDLGWIKPLDGSTSTVGTLSYIGLSQKWTVNDGELSIGPWFVNYQGEEGAEYATNDTEYDNKSIRLDSYFKLKNWKLSFDIGQSVSDFNVEPQFRNEKTAWTAELKYGDLKAIGQAEAYVRWLHVERFGVIQEFAQNATSGHMTANFEGLDLRVRYKLDKNWWIGSRFSQLRSIEGNTKEGSRFRIEAKYEFR